MLPGEAGSTHHLQIALGARAPATCSPSPQLRAPLEALIKTGHRRASSDTLSTGGSARTIVFFLHYSVQEAVKSQPVQGCAGMKQRAEGTESSVVWSINNLEMNSCSLGDCVILSINASHHHLLHFLFFIHMAI